jgi:hypothetical protein
MDEFPARRRLLGQSDPPRNRPEREAGPATPDVVDEDFDLFGAEDAASALIERLNDVQPAAGARSINTAAAPKITTSIDDVLEDVAYRDRARAIAAEMAGTATVEEVLTRLPRGHR